MFPTNANAILLQFNQLALALSTKDNAVLHQFHQLALALPPKANVIPIAFQSHEQQISKVLLAANTAHCNPSLSLCDWDLSMHTNMYPGTLSLNSPTM